MNALGSAFKNVGKWKIRDVDIGVGDDGKCALFSNCINTCNGGNTVCLSQYNTLWYTCSTTGEKK
jgi:hypothetical protein